MSHGFATLVNEADQEVNAVTEISKSVLKEAQKEDTVIGEVLKYVVSKQWP